MMANNSSLYSNGIMNPFGQHPPTMDELFLQQQQFNMYLQM
jgi:hypothetical protein